MMLGWRQHISPRGSLSQCRPIFPWNLHNLDWVRVINIWTSTSWRGHHRSNLFSFDHFYQSSVLTHRPLLCASHEWTRNCALKWIVHRVVKCQFIFTFYNSDYISPISFLSEAVFSLPLRNENLWERCPIDANLTTITLGGPYLTAL